MHAVSDGNFWVVYWCELIGLMPAVSARDVHFRSWAAKLHALSSWAVCTCFWAHAMQLLCTWHIEPNFRHVSVCALLPRRLRQHNWSIELHSMSCGDIKPDDRFDKLQQLHRLCKGNLCEHNGQCKLYSVPGRDIQSADRPHQLHFLSCRDIWSKHVRNDGIELPGMQPWNVLSCWLGELHRLPKRHLQSEQRPGKLHSMSCCHVQPRPELELFRRMSALPRRNLQQSDGRQLFFSMRALPRWDVFA